MATLSDTYRSKVSWRVYTVQLPPEGPKEAAAGGAADEAAPNGRPSLIDLHVGLDLCIKCVWSICYLKGKIWVSWTYGSIVEQPLYVVNEHAGHHWPTVQYSALYICISYNWRDTNIYGQLCTCHDKREWWLRQLSIKYRKSNWNV